MATITKETVEMVNKYAKKFPTMTAEELSKLCGISRSSVSNILNGLYNNLLEEHKDSNTIKSEIPYSTYKNLVTCELCIDEIFKCARKPNEGDERLFLDYRMLSDILERYFPDRFEQRLREVKESSCFYPYKVSEEE